MPCVAEVVNRSLKADCTDFMMRCTKNTHCRRKEIVSGRGHDKEKFVKRHYFLIGYKSNFQKSGGGGICPQPPGSYGTECCNQKFTFNEIDKIVINI